MLQKQIGIASIIQSERFKKQQDFQKRDAHWLYIASSELFGQNEFSFFFFSAATLLICVMLFVKGWPSEMSRTEHPAVLFLFPLLFHPVFPGRQ